MSVRAYGVIARYRAEPLFYRENETLGFFDTEMAVIHRDAYQSGKTALIAFFSEEGLCTYFSAGSLENEQNTVAEPLYSCASTWIFGCHGNRYQYYHPIQEIPDGLTDLVIEDRKVVVSDAVRQKCRVHDFPERVLIR